jgi:hypothetical protein
MTDFFTTPMTTEIQNMVSAGDTNTGEGLRLGMEQMQLPVLRPRSRKVLVFFTDGRPTAFRGIIDGRDRVMAVSVYQTGRVRGYFNNPDRLSMDNLANEDGITNPAQPKGRMYFAPFPDVLAEVFRQLARDLLVRLAQ